MRRLCVACLGGLVFLVGGCLSPRPAEFRPDRPRAATTLTLIGQSSIAPLGRVPPEIGVLFGGISGLAMRGGDLLGLSDARAGGRIYRFVLEGLEGLGGELRVSVRDFTPLSTSADTPLPDEESLAILPNGHFLVSAEGSSREPRRPPALAEYDAEGGFIRVLPVRDRYVPESTGPMTKGARDNAGFEALTLTPDARQLFTATETALVQDDEPAGFEAGTRTRLLEYVAKGNSFVPRREFVYPLERIDRPPFEVGSAFFINGLVDLLALTPTTLLALERGYVEEAGDTGRSRNTIRLYRIALTGATDVSPLEAIKGHPEIVPVTKTLVLDLATVPGLDPALVASGLDNFEGMTIGPRLPDGRATLVLVSDDNFSRRQRTWFLVFAIE